VIEIGTVYGPPPARKSLPGTESSTWPPAAVGSGCSVGVDPGGGAGTFWVAVFWPGPPGLGTGTGCSVVVPGIGPLPGGAIEARPPVGETPAGPAGAIAFPAAIGGVSIGSVWMSGGV